MYEQIQEEVENVARVVETVNVSASPPYRVPLPPTPFVGRQAEMERIAALIESPDTRLLTLSGPGGVGKTRLLNELERHALTVDARVLTGDCVALGEDELPYAPIVAALRYE